MRKSITQNWNKRQLRIALITFFIALAIPIIILISQAYSQLKWEAFHRHQLMSKELITRIDNRLSDVIDIEENRAFTEYSFLNVVGSSPSSFLQRSPLSQNYNKVNIPGLIGYFQINHLNQFSTPLLPIDIKQASKYGISDTEQKKRLKLQKIIQSILSKNKLIQTKRIRTINETKKNESFIASEQTSVGKIKNKTPSTKPTTIEPESPEIESSEAIQSQIAFDNLNAGRRQQSLQKSLPKSLGRLDDLSLYSRYPEKITSDKNQSKEKLRHKRKERNVLPTPTHSKLDSDKLVQETNTPTKGITIFDSEINNIEISILNSGHLVLFRTVWRNNHRYIQGLLVNTTTFLDRLIRSDFSHAALSSMSNLLVAYHGNILSVFSTSNDYRFNSRSSEFKGDLLDRLKLSQPFNDLELVFNIKHLPVSGESNLITAIAFILFIIFIIGFTLMYWLGITQIAISQQHQDFVSAVSHELKTPLTSIRLYGEMLREGWATEDKKKQYYNYIYDESERLSRLIENVLQLSRITHNSLHINLKNISVHELLDNVYSKINSQVEHSKFTLNINCSEKIAESQLNVDIDYFSQIFINLVDNALKFATNSDIKTIDINCELHKQNTIVFSIRDYGPGIRPDQLKKIFKLFYRSENELTRETVGTGIGLALVQQFMLAMDGRIDVINKKPGAEFRVYFPLQ